jgi:hypothetical protein
MIYGSHIQNLKYKYPNRTYYNLAIKLIGIAILSIAN